MDLADLRPTRAVVDLDRLAGNYRAVAAAVPVPIMPVVKADAYGHGATRVAAHLVAAGAPLLAVAYVEEAVALRGAGIAVPLVVMAGFTAAQLPLVSQHALVPVVGSLAMLTALADRPAGSARVTVHLKVDTGMHRLGIAPADAEPAASTLLGCGTVDLGGILTHLASADEDEGATNRQLDIFDGVLARLSARGIRPPLVHAANSAGLRYHRPGHTLARPGLLLYGVRPRPLSPDVAVQPVMRLETVVASVRDVPRGDSVSYGARWTATRPSRIATLPIGYADGVPRTQAMRERGVVHIRGAAAPVAGTICMDLMMADVTDIAAAADSDPVVLMGDAPTAWDVADWAGTNAWEALTRVGARVPRVYIENGHVVAFSSRYRS